MTKRELRLRRALMVAGIALLLGSGFGFGSSVTQAPAQATVPKRVLDTTMVCGTSAYGGVDIEGHRGTGRARGAWDRPAIVSVSNGSTPSGGPDNPTLLDNTLTWSTAGRPGASATLVEYHLFRDIYRIRSWGTHAVNNPHCRPTKARAILSSKGLRGGALGPFDETTVCAVRPRVVVRVRAVLAAPAVLQNFRKFARTTVPVREARVVVQTQSGKRLAYGEVFESGKARIFTAPSCFVR